MQPTYKFDRKQRDIRLAARERYNPEGRLAVKAHKELQSAKTKRILAKVEKSKAKEQAMHARVQAHPLARARAGKLEKKYGDPKFSAKILGAAGATIGGYYGAGGAMLHHEIKNKSMGSPSGAKLAKGVLIGAGIGGAAGAAAGYLGHQKFKRDAPKSEVAINKHWAAKKADPKKFSNRIRYRAQSWLQKEDRDEIIAALMEMAK